MRLAEYKSLLTNLQSPGSMSDQTARKWYTEQAQRLNIRPRNIITPTVQISFETYKLIICFYTN